MAVLTGDPTKPGPYVIRLKVPANTKLPAHYHGDTERVTVISGTFYVGLGDKVDAAKATAFPAG
ncbi:MAG: cupin domain-containing protein, partial [Candidatus Eremiobacteraeota bacterium]|nr:cupin domain-containing protein [Candidatus Eremiobacteraeota bacterium]